MEEVKLSKYALVAKLTSLGFKADIIDGLPYILDVSYDTAEKAIKSLGYEQSWGVKNTNTNINMPIEEEE